MKRCGDTGSDARSRRVDRETAALASQSMVEMGMSAAQVFDVVGLSRSIDAVEALNSVSDDARRAERRNQREHEEARVVSRDTVRTDAPDIGVALAYFETVSVLAKLRPESPAASKAMLEIV
jgi:hypothetical protein